MDTLQTQIIEKLKTVIADDVTDCNARYVDSLNRLQDSLFWQKRESQGTSSTKASEVNHNK